MEKILITGGAGFIGSNLALTLLKRGHQVTVLDNLSEQIHGKKPEETSPLYLSIKDKVRFIKGTVACRETLQKAITDNTIIVHLAAETGTGQSMYEIQHYTDVNIGANSVVSGIFPDYCVIVGAPAKIVKRYCFEQQKWRKTDNKGNFIE